MLALPADNKIVTEAMHVSQPIGPALAIATCTCKHPQAKFCIPFIDLFIYMYQFYVYIGLLWAVWLGVTLLQQLSLHPSSLSLNTSIHNTTYSIHPQVLSLQLLYVWWGNHHCCHHNSWSCDAIIMLMQKHQLLPSQQLMMELWWCDEIMLMPCIFNAGSALK